MNVERIKDIRRKRERIGQLVDAGTPEKLYNNPVPRKKNEIKIRVKTKYSNTKSICRLCGLSFTREEAVLLQIFKERNFFHVKNAREENCWQVFNRICLELGK